MLCCGHLTNRPRFSIVYTFIVLLNVQNWSGTTSHSWAVSLLSFEHFTTLFLWSINKTVDYRKMCWFCIKNEQKIIQQIWEKISVKLHIKTTLPPVSFLSFCSHVGQYDMRSDIENHQNTLVLSWVTVLTQLSTMPPSRMVAASNW